jgi:hypothetical protein
MNSIILNDLDKRVDIKENQILSIDGTNEYLYFSYPVGYGTVSSIYDANNYLIYSHGLTPSTWTYSVINNISSPNGYWGGVSYMVYRTITKVSVPNQYYKFNFN